MSSDLACIHCDLQRHGKASLETHLNETTTIAFGNENRGPRPRFVDRRDPPESADMCQLRESVHVFPSAQWCEELDYSEKELERDFVDGSTHWGRL